MDSRSFTLDSHARRARQSSAVSGIVDDVIYQHAENVCSLWLQRQYAVDEPHYAFADLVHLDDRIEANLDGVRIAGNHGAALLDEMVEAEDPGAHFATGLLALEQGRTQSFHDQVEKAESDRQVLAELESALAWVDQKYLREIVRKLLTSEKSAAIVLGLKACASHGKDPSAYLGIHLRNTDPAVRSAALRVGGESGNVNMLVQVLKKYESETEVEKYELGRALALLGEREAARPLLLDISLSESPRRAQAVDLVVQQGDSKSARGFLKTLDSIDGRDRDVIRGFGLLGDPVAIKWLIEKIENLELSRLAGGAITMISGIDLVDQSLELKDKPDGFKGRGVNDDPDDENVALDEDQDLPWPDPERMLNWWNNFSGLPSGQCFLDGVEKNARGLKGVLLNGMQRQRNAAAVSLALMNAESEFLNTRLPTNRQKAWMS